MGIHPTQITKFFAIDSDVDQVGFLAWAKEVDKAAAISAPVVTSVSTTAPPVAPALGAKYIVPSSGATGAFAGNANKIAWFGETSGGVGAWVFVSPEQGQEFYVSDADKSYVFNGSVWAESIGAGVSTNAPLKGKGTSASPLDVDFSTMPLSYMQALMLKLSTVPNGDASAAALSARLGSSYALENLTNLNITGVTNGQALTFDTASSKWVPKTLLAGVTASAQFTGSGTPASPLAISFATLLASDITALSAKLATAVGGDTGMKSLATRLGGDVPIAGLNDVASVSPQNGQALVWDAVIAKWRPQDVTPALNVASPMVGNGSLATPFGINFGVLATADTQAIVSKIAALSNADVNIISLSSRIAAGTKIGSLSDVDTTGVNNGWVLKYNSTTKVWGVGPDATGAGGTGLTAVSVSTPFGGDGTSGDPLYIDFTLLTSADASDIASAFGSLSPSDAGLIAMAAAVNAARPISVNAPITGNGTSGSPLDIDFSTMAAADARAVSAAIAGDATARSSLTGKIAVAVSAPMTGTGVTGSPLDIDFSTLATADAQSIAAKVAGLGSGDASIVSLATAVLGAGAIGGMANVVVPTPSDGDVLTYDAATSKWKNAAPASGGLASVFADAPLTGHGTSGSHLDIDFSTMSSADTQAIAAKIAADATSLASLASKVSVTANVPFVGNGTSGSPLDIDFSTLVSADTQAIATKIAADATSLATLSAKIAVAVSSEISGNGQTATPLAIAAGGITNAMLRNSSALSLIGRSANSAGAPADIATASGSKAVLRESGGAVGFGAIDVSSTGAVTGQLNAASFPSMTGAVNSAGATLATTSDVDLVFVIGDGQTPIGTGIKGFMPIDFAGTILQWTLVGDAAGSAVVDVWKDTFANFPPTIADVITASAKPTLSAAAAAKSATLTGWTTAFVAGDVFGINVNSASGLKQVTLVLKVRKSS